MVERLPPTMKQLTTHSFANEGLDGTNYIADET
jgi:hypothetical protein